MDIQKAAHHAARSILPFLKTIAKVVITVTYLAVAAQLLLVAFILDRIYGRNIYRKAMNLTKDTLRDIQAQ